jgi:diacylglycerol kinase (ATP)
LCLISNIDNIPYSGSYFLVTFANAPQYGNNAVIAPAASLSDGYLDVTFVKPFPKIFAPLMVISLFAGVIHRMPWVNTLKARRIEIVRTTSPFFHYDGESTRLSWPIVITILPGAVRVLRS